MPIPIGFERVFKDNIFKTLVINDNDYTPKIILLKNGSQIRYTKTDDIVHDKVIVDGIEYKLDNIIDIYKKIGPFTVGGIKSSKRRSLRRSKKQRKSRKYKK